MRVPQRTGTKGSLKWIQRLVNQRPDLIERELRRKLRLKAGERITWVSPLADDEFAEYRDTDFLQRLGITLTKLELADFWPTRGPQWDALGKGGADKIVLVEAKASIPELLSGACDARDDRSREKIRMALDTVASHLKAKPCSDWMRCFYQYVNRLAHLYFLRELNGIQAHLIFLHFINDTEVGGPQTRQEWEAALTVLREALGLPRKLKYVHDLFVDVGDLA